MNKPNLQQAPEALELDKQFKRQAEEVNLTLKSKGWQEVIEPILDKMIEDVIGAKRNGRWDAGSFGGHGNLVFGGTKNTMNVYLSPENLMWYRQALIDFHNRVMQVVDTGTQAGERLKESATESKKQFQTPMLDSSYTPDGKAAQSWSSYNHDQMDDTEGGLRG